MIRKAFLMEVQPGKIDGYEDSHNPIWPELHQVLKDHGVLHHTIFHDAETNLMFAYVEIADEDRFAALASHPICRKWWLHMKKFLVSDDSEAIKAREKPLREVFHLEFPTT